MSYEIYTDGGYSIPQDVGAFAYIVLCDGYEVGRHAEKMTGETSNRAELRAIIDSVLSLPVNSEVVVYSDSQYALNVLSGVYSAKKNLDIISPYWEKVQARGYKIDYKWVKGHNGNKYNELCDQMCNDAAGVNLNYYMAYKSELGNVKKMLPKLKQKELVELREYIDNLLIAKTSNQLWYTGE